MFRFKNEFLTPASVVFTMLCGLSTPAQAQTLGVTQLREEGIRPFAIELKPVTTLMSVIPGVGGIGVGGEVFLQEKWAIFGEGHFINANLPGRTLSKAREKTQDPIPDSVNGFNASTGVRYYAAPAHHSWYANAGVGYNELYGSWDYKGENVDAKLASWTPGVGGGYRWVWDNHMLLRLGAGLTANIKQRRDISPEFNNQVGRDGADKINKIAKAPVVGNLDLGIGYAF